MKVIKCSCFLSVETYLYLHLCLRLLRKWVYKSPYRPSWEPPLPTSSSCFSLHLTPCSPYLSSLPITFHREYATQMSVPRVRVGGKFKPFDAAVIGGGITGLTAAFRLSRSSKCSKVTLYEKSPRLGGFVQSETIPVDGGKIVFEHGPRTIRAPADLDTIVLFSDLVRAVAPPLTVQFPN